MNYEEAQNKAFKVEWIAKECSSKDCWCRMLFPKEPIIYNHKINNHIGMDEEFYIVGSGSINKEFAEYIVDLHNKSLKNQ